MHVLSHSRRLRNSALQLLTTAALAYAATGCSAPRDEGSAAGGSDALDACGLLTRAELEEVLGQAPGDPLNAVAASREELNCVWPSADGSDPQLVHLRIGPRTTATYEDYLKQARQAVGGHFAAHAFKRIEVGDFGVWVAGENFGVLQAFRSHHMVQVSARASGGRGAEENSISLARKVLARLPGE